MTESDHRIPRANVRISHIKEAAGRWVSGRLGRAVPFVNQSLDRAIQMPDSGENSLKYLSPEG